MQDLFAHILEPARAAIERLKRALGPFSPEQLKRWSEVASSVAPIVGQIHEALEEAPARERAAMLTWADHGWYVDPEMPAPSVHEVAEDLRGAANPDPVYDELCAWYTERLPQIREGLSQRHPRRRTVLSRALNAHAAGDYIVSVPLLLAQADGIAQESPAGRQLYATSHRKGLERWAEKAGALPFRMALLAPLVAETTLTAPPHARRGRQGILNRHGVLHGEDCDYGTRVNGFRAISHIVYVDWMLGDRG